MTDVRTFRAATMQEALDRVREEMGREAVILHTRQVARRRLLPLPWRKRREMVEITAGRGVNVRRPKGVPDTPKPASPSPASPPPASGAGTSGEQGPTRSTTRPPAGSNLDGGLSLETDPRAETGHGAKTGALLSAERLNKKPVAASNPSPSDPTAMFADKLDTIEKMLTELGRAGSGSRSPDIPSELFTLYTELIEEDVEDELARSLIFQLKENGSPEQLGDRQAARALLAGLVESQVRSAEPIQPVSGRRTVVALVGATGVGKTTTIAKLAANFRLRDGIKMGLVTVDTYRIAAVEQLRTYAQIIDLPMKVVTSPPEMRRALDEMIGLDLILIDTAGRSPRDELQIQELKSLLAEASVDEVHLVMSMTASTRSLLATAEQFQSANPTSLILTKLDEAAGLGSLLTLTRKVALPVSYLTTGQDVPDDIEPAQPARIARLILGEDKLS